MVAEEYLSNFNFTGMTIDQALRSVSQLSSLYSISKPIPDNNSNIGSEHPYVYNISVVLSI